MSRSKRLNGVAYAAPTLTCGGDLIVMTAWKLCGKCSHEAKHNGGKVPDSLMREAESVSKAALLAMAETGGTA